MFFADTETIDVMTASGAYIHVRKTNIEVHRRVHMINYEIVREMMNVTFQDQMCPKKHQSYKASTNFSGMIKYKKKEKVF